MNVIEPGTKGYRNMSGSVDFVGTLALDPANWFLFGAGAAAKGEDRDWEIIFLK